MGTQRLVEVGSGVYALPLTEVNAYLLRDGDELTLVDAGYPGDTAHVLAAIGSLGLRPQSVRAVLLTHAHVDHMGAATHLHERFGTPLYTDPVEVPHARREYLEQAGPLDVVRNLWRPGVAPWALRITRAGAAKKVAVPFAQPFPGEGPLDLPGAPVPVATHGHTSGHTAYLVPAAGAVLTGDALVTGHAVSRVAGPQVIAGMFQHGGGPDPVAALDALRGLAADVVLPGHGPVHRGDVTAAVEQAQRRARG